MKKPTEPGYYWAKMFHKEGKADIVLVTKNFTVLVSGDQKRYSFHYDVAVWCSDKLEFPNEA